MIGYLDMGHLSVKQIADKIEL
jgi:hypothetical protein